MPIAPLNLAAPQFGALPSAPRQPATPVVHPRFMAQPVDTVEFGNHGDPAGAVVPQRSGQGLTVGDMTLSGVDVGHLLDMFGLPVGEDDLSNVGRDLMRLLKQNRARYKEGAVMTHPVTDTPHNPDGNLPRLASEMDLAQPLYPDIYDKVYNLAKLQADRIQIVHRVMPTLSERLRSAPLRLREDLHSLRDAIRTYFAGNASLEDTVLSGIKVESKFRNLMANVALNQVFADTPFAVLTDAASDSGNGTSAEVRFAGNEDAPQTVADGLWSDDLERLIDFEGPLVLDEPQLQWLREEMGMAERGARDWADHRAMLRSVLPVLARRFAYELGNQPGDDNLVLGELMQLAGRVPLNDEHAVETWQNIARRRLTEILTRSQTAHPEVFTALLTQPAAETTTALFG